MFSDPANGGDTKEKPFRLDAIDKGDFVAFLKILCPRHPTQWGIIPRNPQVPDLGLTEWVSVLKLATLWQFDEAKKIAIYNLNIHTVCIPVMRIKLARTYNIPEWLMRGLSTLARQRESLSVEDVDQLGVEFSLKVAELRGKVLGFKRANNSSPVPVMSLIKEGFPDAITTGSEDEDESTDAGLGRMSKRRRVLLTRRNIRLA